MAYQQYYELRSTVQDYLAFHYPDADPLAALLGEWTPPIDQRFPFGVRRLWKPGGRALDVGSAVGRTTFDLARDHRMAWGLERSRALVRAAREVQHKRCARYRIQLEGDLATDHEVAVEAPANAAFLVGDAHELSFRDQSFDTVLALNLIDRLPDPSRALDELQRVVGPQGTLIIASPYTWLPEYTPKERWLGGFEGEDGPVRGFDTVRRCLDARFTLREELRMPFFIPHHARSGQLGLAHIQVFTRNP